MKITYGKKRTAQISLEFMILIGFGMAVLIGVIYIANIQMEGIGRSENTVEMRNLGEAIKQEIILASQVKDSYMRRFEIPAHLNAHSYEMRIEDKSSLLINMPDNEQQEYFTLPRDVDGQFVKVEPGFLDYCISKGKDSVTISRNLISLSYGGLDDDDDLQISNSNGANEYDITNKLTNGVLSVGSNKIFSLYLKVNCVDNFQHLDVEVKHDGFSFVEAKQAHDHDTQSAGLAKWYGDVVFEGNEKQAFYSEQQCVDIITNPPDKCLRIIISHAGANGPSGSDALIELVFEKINGISITLQNPKLVDAQIRLIPPEVQGITIS